MFECMASLEAAKTITEAGAKFAFVITVTNDGGMYICSDATKMQDFSDDEVRELCITLLGAAAEVLRKRIGEVIIQRPQ